MYPITFKHVIMGQDIFTDLLRYKDSDLRPYQNDNKEQIYKSWNDCRAVMLQMPTGTGKTRLFVSILKDLHKYAAESKKQIRVLILVHRVELIDQISEELGVRYGLAHGFIHSKDRERRKFPFQIASVQTLNRRLDNWKDYGFDFIIVDEAHEGTKTELGEAVMKELTKERTKILRLSGTPFNLFDDYKEDEIYTWDYVMEQRAKAEWDLTHFGDPNPYAGLPRLNIYTYDLNKLLDGYGDSELAFNFREFFRVNEDGEFVHKTDVEAFLNLICKKDEDSNYPYSTEEYRDNFRHSLWVVPGVKSAKALSTMLQSHAVFSQFQVVNVAGEGDDDQERDDALELVNKAIGNKPEDTYTITLSCGRLTTGVSVKAWTAVFMLAGSFSTAASSYMQTIFRVQTPATIGGKVKEECFVFDFAPDRTLKVIAETAKISAKAGKTTSDDRKAVGDFINFCPIIAYEASKTPSSLFHPIFP